MPKLVSDDLGIQISQSSLFDNVIYIYLAWQLTWINSSEHMMLWNNVGQLPAFYSQ